VHDEDVYYSVQQVILPLLEQFVKSHCLYFLSTSLCSRSYASKKEKEMIARYVSPCSKHMVCWLHWRYLKVFFFVLRWKDSSVMFCRIITVSLEQKKPHSVILSSLLRFSFLLTSSLFCKLAALVRHRISLFGKDGVEINKAHSDVNSPARSLFTWSLGLLFRMLLCEIPIHCVFVCAVFYFLCLCVLLFWI